MRFTVLIPTFNNGAMIHSAIQSVLAQSWRDFELWVVADGAPELTHNIVKEYAGRDSRVHLHAFPKGERHGEAWRHQVLAQATGEAVCYLGDDDFWFPDHLQVMAELLRNADFAHTRHTAITPYFEVFGTRGDLTDPELRQRMLTTKYNIFGPTVVGHRLEAYRRLPHGWHPAPPDLWTDLHMWRQWLTTGGMHFKSDPRITTIHIPRVLRQHLPPDKAMHETPFWYELFKDPAMREALRRFCPVSETPLPLAAIVAEARQNKNFLHIFDLWKQPKTRS